ncbi:PQQ-binding-like beta-propeller repeat protein [Nocardia cyriacigeorgica]|uniref:outer membrane protein assembly factor BamB family protein n=1 Tax=Nocardia cyriacigeorgica TaxID=135487 RepID=UPI0003014F84|nr:PQQ-binding-like beta-propeller repeat protein [Nocardia cyriacigeorgica]
MNDEPVFDLRPRHVARVLGILFTLPVAYIFGIEGITTEIETDLVTGESSSTSDAGTQIARAAIWIVLAAIAGGVEWWLRTRDVEWPPGTHAFLVRARLADPAAYTRSTDRPRPMTTASADALFDLRPHHAAFAGAGLAMIAALFNPPGLAWLIIVAGCVAFGWQARNKQATWPPAVREFLARMRLAEPGSPADEPSAGPAPDGQVARVNRPQRYGPLIPLRPLTAGEILRASITAIRRHWQVSLTFTVAALVAALSLFLLGMISIGAALISGISMEGENFAAGLFATLAALVLLFVSLLIVIGVPADAAINAVTIVTADMAIRGEPVRFAAVFALVRPRLFALCRLMAVFYAVIVLPGLLGPYIVLIAVGLPAAIPVLVLTVAAVFVVGTLCAFAPIVMTREGAGVVESFRRSVALVRPSLARVLGLELLWVAACVVAFAATAYPALAFASAVPGGEVIVYPVSLVIIAASAVLIRTLQTLLYTDLRIREGSYDPTPQPPPGPPTPPEGTAGDDRAPGADIPGRPAGTAAPMRVAGESAAVSAQDAASDPPVPMAAMEVPGSDVATPTAPTNAFGQPFTPATGEGAESAGNRPPSPPTRPQLTKPATGADPAPVVPTTGPSMRDGSFAQPGAHQPPHGQTTAEPTAIAGPNFGDLHGGAEAPHAAHRRSRRHPLFVTALIAVVALVVGGAGIWWLGHEDHGSPLFAQNHLRNTYPAAPSEGWTFYASEVARNEEFSSPRPSPEMASSPGLIDLGEILIVQTILPSSDKGETIVALDSHSGKMRWRADGGYETCATRTVDGLLPCIRENGFGPDHRSDIVFLSVEDGTVERTSPAVDPAWVEVVGEDIITASYSEIASGTVEDLRAHWRTRWSPDPTCPGSGDSYRYGANDEFVFFGSDAGAIVVRRSDGKRVIDADLQAIAAYPGQGLIAQTCSAADPTDGDTVVLDAAGNHIRTHPGRGWPAKPLAGGVDALPYITSGAAWDFSNGSQRWSSSEIEGGGSIIDDTVVLGHTGGWMSAVDLQTGAELWTSDDSPADWATDRQRLILADGDGELEAINLRTGDREWSTSVESGALEPAGAGFAIINENTVTYYPPTGGTAGEPGSSGSDESGATKSQLITACGKPPTLTPVEYRTGNDGLVVRMELRANCSSGDIISTDALRIEISERGQPIASGVFDFSESPIYLPTSDGDASDAAVVVEHEFEFPIGSFWRLPNSLGAHTDPTAQSAMADESQVVRCTDEGTDRGPREGRYSADAVDGTPFVATRSGAAVADPEAAALDALRAQADADRPTVGRDLADRWVPQLSSKQVGLVAPDVDGRIVTWTPTKILQQHLRMRLQYPEVRLVWSDEWSTFDLRGWWITVAGVTHSSPDPANGWCDAKNIPTDECFAKLVSNSRGPEGTTKYR